MAYTDLFTNTMDIISQSLSIPVLIILLVFVAIAIIILGSCIREYYMRPKIKITDIENLIFNINSSDNIGDVEKHITNSQLSDTDKTLLVKLAQASVLKKSTREALARKLVENEEKRINQKLRLTDIITRIGPTLGLMGTLIPMGPGLAALGAGDINTLASSLTVAFNTTIIGIGSGALCYVIGKIRTGWYDDDLSNLDALTDALLDYMG